MKLYQLAIKKGQNALIKEGDKLEIDLPSGKHVALVIYKQSEDLYMITFDGINLNHST